MGVINEDLKLRPVPDATGYETVLSEVNFGVTFFQYTTASSLITGRILFPPLPLVPLHLFTDFTTPATGFKAGMQPVSHNRDWHSGPVIAFNHLGNSTFMSMPTFGLVNDEETVYLQTDLRQPKDTYVVRVNSPEMDFFKIGNFKTIHARVHALVACYIDSVLPWAPSILCAVDAEDLCPSCLGAIVYSIKVNLQGKTSLELEDYCDQLLIKYLSHIHSFASFIDGIDVDSQPKANLTREWLVDKIKHKESIWRNGGLTDNKKKMVVFTSNPREYQDIFYTSNLCACCLSKGRMDTLITARERKASPVDVLNRCCKACMTQALSLLRDQISVSTDSTIVNASVANNRFRVIIDHVEDNSLFASIPESGRD